jgi:hypothetical protein
MMTHRCRPELLFAVGLSLLLAACPAMGLDADFRIKWFSAAGALPDHDLQRQIAGTPSYDHTLDLRLMLQQPVGSLNFLLDHSTVLLSGDAVALGRDPNSAVDQTVTNDARRWFDLTWDIEDGKRHQSFHRLDRLAVQWQPGDWSFTFGRQAVSWGSGIVFQPLDLFSPFSPTVVDRDYKAGDDLLLVDRLLSNGQDLQLLHVVRRDVEGHVDSAVSSTAFKWHGYAGAAEFELVAAQHYDERVLGASLRMGLGQALVRADVVATRYESLLHDDKEWRVSGIVNADVSFMLGQRNAYVFGEYFHNDWGVDELPATIVQLPPELQERLQRGELFNLMRDYLAVGGSIEWHPLVTHTLTLISNLHDSSSLLQMQINYEPGDHQRLQFGWLEPLGARGDEFGGVPVVTLPNPNPNAPPLSGGQVLTTGGASRFYLRWVYFI